MSRAIIHLDLDAFYASVEQRDNPSLRGQPVIVGGHPTRGVVLAASYEVRPFGVRSAMPMSRALKLAPQARVVPPRFSAYVEASEQVFEILGSVTPLVEPLSLDEAFLDVTGSKALFGAPAGIAEKLRARILTEVGLKSSAGISAVKFVAKICSDLAKPNGQREVPEEETLSFLAPLEVKRLWGVGPKLEETLRGLGLKTIGDIARRELGWLQAKLGASTGEHLFQLSQGVDERQVVPDRQAKSIGAEDTFEEDLDNEEALAPHLHAQALRVGRRLRSAHVKTRVVQLKLKLSDFTLLTRRLTLDEATDDGQALYRAALGLFRGTKRTLPLRLTGVSAQELVGAGEQLGLFPEAPKKTEKLNQALDAIEARFGRRAIRTADLQGTTERDDREE
jgi:DNA polymerase-4